MLHNCVCQKVNYPLLNVDVKFLRLYGMCVQTVAVLIEVSNSSSLLVTVVLSHCDNLGQLIE